jgi:hypothetical protein
MEIVREIYADPRGLIAAAAEWAAPDVAFDFSDVYPDRPVLLGVEEMRWFRETGPWGGSPSILSRNDSSTWTTNGSWRLFGSALRAGTAGLRSS